MQRYVENHEVSGCSSTPQVQRAVEGGRFELKVKGQKVPLS